MNDWERRYKFAVEQMEVAIEVNKQLIKEKEALVDCLKLVFTNSERLMSKSDEFWVIDRQSMMQMKLVLEGINSRKHSIESENKNDAR